MGRIIGCVSPSGFTDNVQRDPSARRFTSVGRSPAPVACELPSPGTFACLLFLLRLDEEGKERGQDLSKILVCL
jgi:hypothetical protein